MEDEEEDEEDEMDGCDEDEWGVAVSITSPEEEGDPEGNRNSMSPCLQREEGKTRKSFNTALQLVAATFNVNHWFDFENITADMSHKLFNLDFTNAKHCLCWLTWS